MKIGDVVLPDKCPEFCPYHQDTQFYPLCERCPMFLCAPGEYEIVPPEEYNRQWAQEFADWFDSKCAEEKYPLLEFPIDLGMDGEEHEPE